MSKNNEWILQECKRYVDAQLAQHLEQHFELLLQKNSVHDSTWQKILQPWIARLEKLEQDIEQLAEKDPKSEADLSAMPSAQSEAAATSDQAEAYEALRLQLLAFQESYTQAENELISVKEHNKLQQKEISVLQAQLVEQEQSNQEKEKTITTLSTLYQESCEKLENIQGRFAVVEQDLIASGAEISALREAAYQQEALLVQAREEYWASDAALLHAQKQLQAVEKKSAEQEQKLMQLEKEYTLFSHKEKELFYVKNELAQLREAYTLQERKLTQSLYDQKKLEHFFVENQQVQQSLTRENKRLEQLLLHTQKEYQNVQTQLHQTHVYLSNIEAERNAVLANREKWREEYQQLEAKFLAKEKQREQLQKQLHQLQNYLAQSEAERNELAILCQNLRAANKQ